MTTSTLLKTRNIDPQMPAANGLPFVGVLPAMARNPIKYIMAAHQQHGDIYRLNLGVTKIIMLNHPDHAQHVLIDNARNYTKGGPIWDSLRTLLGNGLPVSEGDFWRRQRRMMQPHFHRQRLAAITDQMIEAIDEGVASWSNQAGKEDRFNLMDAMSQITMRVIVRALFGTSIAKEDMERVTVELTIILEQLIQGVVTQNLPSWIPIPGRRRYQQAIQAIDDVVFGVIERYQQKGSSLTHNGAVEGSVPDDNLIAMLLDLVDDETGEQMTPQQLRDEAVTMFLAGYETTAVTLAWAFHFLTQQPVLLEKLQTEIDTVLGDRTPTFADLPQLTFTRMVLQEAMRYYSPSWQLTRTAEEDDVIDGYPIPAGSVVAVMQQVIHHHPAIWPEPSQFDPERFTPEAEKARPKQSWIPFGAGQRLCIGKEMALMEGQLVLARILQAYNVQAIPGEEAVPHAAMTLRPKDGVWASVTPKA